MKNYFPCLSLLVLLFLSFPTKVKAQTASYGQNQSLRVEAQATSDSVTITWATYSAVSSYRVYKMSNGAWPSSPDAIYSSSVTSHTDTNVTSGQIYEYMIVGTRSGTDAVGYIVIGHNVQEHFKGTLALIVDSSLVDDLEDELETYMLDAMGDGYDVVFRSFDTSLSAETLKDTLAAIYGRDSNLTTAFLVGNLPYYYTGEMSPDGHSDHHGAWPSDMMLADLDGSYSDNIVRYTNTIDDRLTNKRNDDKMDQSYLSSDADIQIGRLDMTDLTSFSGSLTSLYQGYFDKLHAFKIGEFVPRQIGIVDDNFLTFSEGFSNNGYRNFAPLVGIDSVFDADIVTTTGNTSALWSYACGAGTYTSISGFTSTSALASKDLNGVFAMVLGSYNADPDVENNLMRAMLANGNFLTVSWAGRPNWFVQHMAVGLPIGYSTMMTQNNNGLYEPTGYYPTSMHILLLGDPTLKNHYTPNVTGLTTIRTVGKDTALLSWSSVSGALGYNIYRSLYQDSGYVKLNSSLVTSTNYNDPVQDSINYYYRVEAVEMAGGASGSYYQSSVGSYVMSDYTADPVPVTLIGFSAEAKEEVVELNWTVAQEINFSHYSIEKFDEQTNSWKEIAQVHAKGVEHGITYYKNFDRTPIVGKNIYRLKMVDYDMSFEYSPIAVVIYENGGRYGEFTIFPQPAKDVITVNTSFAGDFDERTFVVLASNGQEVMRTTINEYENKIDISTLPVGLYFIKDLNNLGETQKLVVVD